jgi:O-antigen/teichoic acid export membrane protein
MGQKLMVQIVRVIPLANSTLKNAAIATVGNYIEFFITLLVSIVIARGLGPELYGQYAFIIWLSGFFIAFMTVGVSTGAIKYLAEATGRERTDQYYGLHVHFRKIQLAIISLSLIIFMLSAYYFDFRVADSRWLAFFLALSVGLKAVHMYRVSALKGLEQFWRVSLIAFIVSPLNLLVVFIAFTYQADIVTFFWIYILSSSFYHLVSYFLLRDKIPKIKKPLFNETLDRTLVKNINHHILLITCSSTLGFVVMRQSELYFLNLFASSAEVAFFNVAFVLASAVVTLVPGALDAILLPLVARSLAKSTNDAAVRLQAVFRFALHLSIIVAIPLVYFAEDLIVLMYGQDYLAAVFPFQAILIVLSFGVFASTCRAFLLSDNRQAFMLKLTSIATFFTLLLDYLLVKNFGLFGAVIAFVSTTFFVSFIQILMTVRWAGLFIDTPCFLRSFVAALIAFLMMHIFNMEVQPILNMFFGSVIFVSFYLFIALILKVFKVDDINILLTIKKKAVGDRFFGFDSLLRRYAANDN